ncbi:MAG: anaerobic carbon-monoxide dehydrogenase catalytic subunit [Desulfarculaceae bacterium]|nr:anaerobic carbon-monoxide dehydrogenase catalytic subunit [Desulfarculaceae bacterium]MCF8073778.1 anaerobic carbon-monoxide dehydrogenase catalytic subunit [Desulfarculaceae bacterium]MCF8102019.1 anaerobic carbon-monoxide dehydrogenase catalytic subunit [Desulfarculaceae bacterium]MCF8115989.1 anaerobic carbon-monoxide dehydrogenase catalytic subunit [Desulfarculaceae bacterium]
MSKDDKLQKLTSLDPRDQTICESTQKMLAKARKDGVETAFDRALTMKPCPIGEKSACCKNCFMGPCRLNAKDPYGKVGVCGATIDTIQSRNFGRAVATGTSSHTDHGFEMLKLFKGVITGELPDYQINDPEKLLQVAEELGIRTEEREFHDVAMDLYYELEKTYIQTEGEIPFIKRAPAKTQETWREEGVVPRGAMREIMELMNRTHMGMDQDYDNLSKQISRCALSDGWGGSMVATEIGDMLFGTPYPVTGEVNMGVLKADQVNVIIHGHEPNLFDSMLTSVSDPELIAKAEAAGAAGINLVGMCCSGLEMLSRKGVPHAGNFMSTEAVLVTGAVDAMAVDVQCIKQGLAKVAECYGTKLFTTNPRTHIEGVMHVEFEEAYPRECTDTVVDMAIKRYASRTAPIDIPQRKDKGVFGFSDEYINYMLGGSFRGSYTPLNDNIINGRIRGVAGVVGCTNPRVKQDWVHVELVKELIKNDVLVVMTGCAQVALAKAGLLTPEAAHLAGPGLQEVCETVGIPPVLGLGSCVDNTRILTACCNMVAAGGLGDAIADLPVAGAAPEYMSEKAIAIGQYFVASGVYTIFGVTFPMVEGTKFHDLMFEGLEDRGMGKWDFTPDPHDMAQRMLAHIEKKRQALGLDKSTERVLVDMDARRALSA